MTQNLENGMPYDDPVKLPTLKDYQTVSLEERVAESQEALKPLYETGFIKQNMLYPPN